MRVALISDLHGNPAALEAVLDAVKDEGVDRIVCLGDVATLGPEPNAVIGRLMQLGCPCILGNHDEFLLKPELIAGYTAAPLVVQSIAWCSARLTAAEREFLGSMKQQLELDLGDGVRLACFHGSPRSHTENLLATTSDEQLDEALGTVQAEVIAFGHTHLQMVRQHRGRMLVNPGSVGMPFKQFAGGGEPTVMSHAEYATVQAHGGRLRIAAHRVPVDLGALQAQLRGSDLPLRASLSSQYGL
jgi:putative phosphoesterase